ncbi:MAG: glycosyltransferase family 2 protein, partial [Candidatus Omnitrophica bacterium]|nr:glycosyltransferase family 2 protein [Candidatus Omnitrophota bacterium]
ALRRGFQEANKEWVFYTDGDGQYDIKQIFLLLEHKETSDIVTGYKTVRRDSLLRIVVGKIYHWINKIIFDIRVKDVDCDFRLIKKAALDAVSFKTDTGFFPVELVRRLQDNQCRFREVPVTHYYRKTKSSQFFKVSNIFRTVMSMKSFWKELHAEK